MDGFRQKIIDERRGFKLEDIMEIILRGPTPAEEDTIKEFCDEICKDDPVDWVKELNDKFVKECNG